MDAIVELFAALAIGVAQVGGFVISVVLQGVFIVVEFIFVLCTGGFAAAKEKSKQSIEQYKSTRENKSRGAAATEPEQRQSLILAGLVVLVLVLSVGTFVILETIKQSRVDATRVLVKRVAKRIVAEVEAGHPPPVQGDLAERDAWKQPLQLFVDEALLGELYVVRSLGPDRKSGTLDDILSPEIRIASTKEIAEELFDRGKQNLKEKFAARLKVVKEDHDDAGTVSE